MKMADASGAETAGGAASLTSNNKSDSSRSKSKSICRFYSTKSGCRAGRDCKFLHPDATSDQESRLQDADAKPTGPSTQPTPVPTASRVVTRPVPKAQTDEPRIFQIGQIQRRFKPVVSEQDGSTTMTFSIKPSDPDFPYEIEQLECALTVPGQYPSASASLSVKNKDIPRGFQINIERGFNAIASKAPTATLLTVLNRLDNQLETILSGQMAETIKIVSNKSKLRDTANQLEKPQASPSVLSPSAHNQPATTETQRTQAGAMRQSDMRQLEARFGRLQAYAKSSDGSTYTLPLDSPKRSNWPSEMQQLRTFKLTVPELYPVEPARIQLESKSEEAKAVEYAFKKHAMDEVNLTLTQQINYLTQNLSSMAVVEKRSEPIETQSTQSAEPADTQSVSKPKPETDKSHIQYIPRPPEWDRPGTDSSDEDSSDGDSMSVSGDEDTSEAEVAQNEQTVTNHAPAERGILLSFPHLELHGIELMELISLNIMVKCERCKDTMDIERLRDSTEGSKEREVSCKKCATTFGLRFRRDFIHANSVRGGYLDLDGCTVIDMLPSNFIPTCSECSTAYPTPGISAVRGDSAMAICRECHHRISVRIQEVKFLQISQAAIRASRAPGQKKKRENLGITAGTELPSQGRCSHYKKSYRWFRFACCNKVFACDRCHDAESDHPAEFANRMLCGFCSREQNFRPDDCGICHHALTGKKGRGFWEGGKGTRDPAKMSRKDPRKYKRRPGTKPKT